jgi:hypothetical protein
MPFTVNAIGFNYSGSGTPGDPYAFYLSALGGLAYIQFTASEPGLCYLNASGYEGISNNVEISLNSEILYVGSMNWEFNYPISVLAGQVVTLSILQVSQSSGCQGTCFFYPDGSPEPPVPNSLYVIDQPGLVSSGNLLSPQPSVGIKDQFGNVLTNYETDVQVSLVVLSGSATLTGTDTVSTTNGVATFTDLIITGNGLFYLHFESTILVLNAVDSNQLFFPPDPGNPNPPIPVKPKRSYIAGSVPAYTDLEINEFAINVADRKGYMRDSNDIVHLLFDGYATGGGGSGGTVYSVGVSSQDLTVTNSPITSTGFIGLELNTQSITAGAYGDGSNVAEVTVNGKGIITGIQNIAISYPVNSITAGTDISLTGTAPDYTINNTAPDQIVSLTSGTGISVTGTYPSFTIDSTITQYTDADARLSLSAGTGISYDNTTGVITNDAPDQIVALTGGTDISVTGTYPNFTIDYTGTNTGVTSIIAGTGISVDVSTGDVTVTNTDPDQIVSLTAGTGINVTGTYPSFTIDSTITQYTDSDARLALSAGTGISYDNTTGVITNDAPDQTVSLTGGTDISVTGTYPNFTIDYTGTPGSGTVTSVGITTTSTALTISNSPITTSGDIGVNFSGKGSEYVTGDGSLKTFPTTIDQALNLVTEVYNSTGSTLTKGTVVYINGGQGNLPTVTKAQANNDANSAQTYGIIQSDISDQDNGYVVVSGRLTDIDTQSYSTGTQLYLSPTTAGAWTTTKPSAPSHLVYVGIVVYQHPTQGVVEVKIQNGYELHELHDVSITSVAPNNILRYNSSTKLWENVAGTTSSISEGSNLYYTDARVRLALSAGTGITYDNSTGKITNSSPDQTVVLTAGTGISTTGTYPNFTINSTITQYTDSDARKSLSSGTGISYDNTTGVITNSSPDQTVKLTGGTGISTSGTYPNFTITNSAPDQTVTLTSGTGISTSGTYPSFTITNTSPDQTVKLTSGTGISTSGTYPNFTITNAAPDQTVTLTAGTGIGVTGTYPSFTISSTITQYTDSDARKSLSAGTGITYDNTTGIITNADPDQVVSLTAGTSISISGTYPSFTITNDDPDQIVSLTGGTDISITGTYPSFTINYTGTAGTGTVTSVDMSVPTGLKVSGNPITTTGTLAVTFDTGYSIPTTSDQTNWSTAYTDRLKWDGGSSGLTASTGRTSLGATTIGSNLFTLTNPSAVTFPRFNADNTVSALDATNFRTAIGAGTSSTTGTVTSIATTSPITGGTITGSGTIGINSSSTNTASYVVQRDASGNFSAGTITASLTGTASSATNLAGGGAGQVPYNTASGATSFLAAGTSGQILRSNGTSAPSWEVQGLFSSGRLTLESNVPVSTTDQTSKTTIYYTPYNGDKISLYNGSSWATYTFTQLSKSLGTLANNSNYDVFLYNNSGTLTLELSAAWTSNTARNVSDALTLINGIYVKSSLTSRRYLGTFRTTSTTTTEDSLAKRFVWNMNNPVERLLYKNTYPTYAYTGHPYTTASWRNWNNDSTMSVHFVNGLDRNVVVNFGCASSAAYASQGAAFDGGTPGYDSVDMTGRAGRAYTIRSGSCLGYHYCTMMEFGTSGSTYIQGILEGSFWC